MGSQRSGEDEGLIALRTGIRPAGFPTPSDGDAEVAKNCMTNLPIDFGLDSKVYIDSVAAWLALCRAEK